MRKRYSWVIFILIIFCVSSYPQDSTIVNKGFQFRIISSYVNISNQIEAANISNKSLRFFANIKSGIGWGASVGYRFHGKASIDASIDMSYIYSSHRVQYQYPTQIMLPTIDSDLLNYNEINRLNFHTFSFDVSVYFYSYSRFQPYVSFGFETYLNNVRLQAKAFDYHLDSDHPRLSYGFNKTYSGYDLHLGAGLSYYFVSNIAINGYVRANEYFFNCPSFPRLKDEEFNILNVSCGCSISILF